MKKWWLIVCLLVLPVGNDLYQTHIKRTRGFCLQKVLAKPRRADKRWETTPRQPLDPILSQAFHYFGSGKTCYAFLSDDGNYVIKLLKQNHMRPFSWYEKCLGFPLIPTYQTKLQKREQFRENLYSSFLIAYRDFSQHTGVIYLHLNRTKHLNQVLYFSDKNKETFTLDADKAEFLIQKKSERIFPTIETWIASEQIDQAKAAIDSICDLIQARCALGIEDDDNNCERNLGLIGTQAIEIDIGEFKAAERSAIDTQQHLTQATQDLANFLKKRSPALYQYLMEKCKHGKV